MSCCALQAESYNQTLRAVPPTGPPPYARAPVLCAVSVAFSSYREARAAHIGGRRTRVCVCVCVMLEVSCTHACAALHLMQSFKYSV